MTTESGNAGIIGGSIGTISGIESSNAGGTGVFPP